MYYLGFIMERFCRIKEPRKFSTHPTEIAVNRSFNQVLQENYSGVINLLNYYNYSSITHTVLYYCRVP